MRVFPLLLPLLLLLLTCTFAVPAQAGGTLPPMPPPRVPGDVLICMVDWCPPEPEPAAVVYLPWLAK